MIDQKKTSFGNFTMENHQCLWEKDNLTMENHQSLMENTDYEWNLSMESHRFEWETKHYF